MVSYEQLMNYLNPLQLAIKNLVKEQKKLLELVKNNSNMLKSQNEKVHNSFSALEEINTMLDQIKEEVGKASNKEITWV